MLLLLSPAKTLDFESDRTAPFHTQPRLLDRSALLIERLRRSPAAAIRKMMKVSEKIADLNVERFLRYHTPFDEDNARAALLAFQGDVYRGLGVADFSEDDLRFSQDRLRILSGLYGLLRPLDLMQAYRLEMGTRLDTEGAKNLYEFWGSRITDLLNEDLATTRSTEVVNLASNEYFKAVQADQLNGDLYKVDFKEHKNGQYKIVAIFAKVARGKMARYAVKERLTSAEQLKDFSEDGYQYHEELSADRTLVFTR